ncbi:hypothetical protein [Sandarakinorhabdus sp.]|uniref:hypothetical protein n=1 Tax=Sandarakinorhabdus sp. TaxID=1916663 RepID=UPI003F6F9E07
MKNRHLVFASAALLLATAGSAQQQQSGNFLDQLLGGIFGNNSEVAEQALESDWNQGQRPFEQRRQRLDSRIDAAVRDGTISSSEADYMHREYNEIVRLEAQYGANGQITQQQRGDLRTRYRAMTQRINSQHSNGFNGGQNGYQNGGQNGGQNSGQWQSIAQQNNLFEQRLGEALRNRRISQAEANRLRNDWRTLAQVEGQYQRSGIDAREQADLWTRYNAIDARMGGVMGGMQAGGFGNDGNTQRWRQMETRLVAAQRAGRVNATQVAQMRATMGDLERLDAAYGRTGYSAEQRTYLSRRYGELDAALGYDRR